MHERQRPQFLRGARHAAEDPVEEAAALAQVPLQDPVPPRRDGEPHLQLDVACGGRPGQGSAMVVEILIEDGQQRLVRIGAAEPRRGSLLHARQDVLAVAPAQDLGLTRGLEQLAGVLAARLEHREPGLAGGPAQGADGALVEDRVSKTSSPFSPQTASAASRVQPPANTASLAKSVRSSSSRRPWLHSSVARRVRWRPGRS